MEPISAIKQLVNQSIKKIVITMHANPDADALGASLALAAFLKKKQHHVTVISPNGYPDFLEWLPDIENVLIYDQLSTEKTEPIIEAADLIFCVDFAMLHRINNMAPIVANAKAIKIVIDHHLDIEQFAHIMLWEPTAAASAELVFRLIDGIGEKAKIDAAIASCLYVGIMTDTGSFKNPNTTPAVHRIVAELMDLKIDVARIHKLVYDNNTLDKLRFLSFMLSKRLVIMADNKTAYLIIKSADARNFNLTNGDTEGLVNYALSIKGIQLAALIKEKKDAVYLSLRSVGDVPVNTFAKTYFEGGGHKNAAGGISHLTIQETINKFEFLVKNKFI